jgi:hypothetical protein
MRGLLSWSHAHHTREALYGSMSARRVAVLVALAFLLGAGGAALAVEILRGPERSSVDPIELRVEDERSEDGDERRKPRERKKPRGARTGDGRDGGTQAPRGGGDESEGVPPAPPAPPAPAGDDDDDDDGGDDSDDDGDD